tara:strand:+ start:351 stop:482 length:132 start_codon:yes stop_codon:yes gene_type:complete
LTKKNESRNGKGGAYRIPVGDKLYKYNYNKIFKRKKLDREKLD